MQSFDLPTYIIIVIIIIITVVTHSPAVHSDIFEHDLAPLLDAHIPSLSALVLYFEIHSEVEAHVHFHHSFHSVSSRLF